jgi:SAM-dependent methyltransferase
MFKDHFSRQSDAYSRYRPGYPAELIDFFAGLADRAGAVVDCATGNGQAAVDLAAHFDRVVAVDASRRQLALARPHPKVHYVAATAERLPLRNRSVVMVAAAQAAHWFDFERFHAECRRVLVPGGVVALWSYEKFRIDPGLDAAVDRFYSDVIGPYWPPERRYVEQGYRTLPFPFAEIPAPTFALRTDWDLDRMMGYLATWSAVQRYKDAGNGDPLPRLRDDLEQFWSGSGERRIHWPIHLRVGRV